MEMIKSCVSSPHIYHTKMFFSTPKSRWYGDEHGNNKQKSQSKFKNKNKLQKHTVKTTQILKIHFKTLITDRKHLLCDCWFHSMTTWYNQIKAWQTLSHIHKVLFGGEEYFGYDFHVSYKKHDENHENAWMPKHWKIYTSKSFMYIWTAAQHIGAELSLLSTCMFIPWIIKADM